MKRLFWFIVCFGLCWCVAYSQPPSETILGTKHNLSISGVGTIRSTTEDEICIFCHTPHSSSGSAPLWNRSNTATLFDLYPSGGTIQSFIGQPNGSSRNCLSCHDGTIAIGLVLNPNTTIPMQGTTLQGRLPAGSTHLGSALADDHPISFTPSLADAEIILPTPNSAVKLDHNGQMQCRSCHDPHHNAYGKFLVMNPANGALCTTCHLETGWNNSVHFVPNNPQFAQMTTQACNSCHVSHNAQSPAQLLKLNEETLCFSCHDGVQNADWEVNGATNLVNVFQKVSVHPITFSSGVHQAGEGPINSIPVPTMFLPEQSPIAPRHVECVDCHNSHAVSDVNGVGQINGALRQVWGIGIDGLKVDVAQYEYQICLKCHGDSQNLPAGTKSKRREMALTNASYHPVFGVGRNTDVPGLLSPWTTSSVLNCTDCHGNSDPFGVQGPHGSDYAPLLKANYEQGEGRMESPLAYALCYTCHDRNTLYNPSQSYFPYHTEHVVNSNLSCKLCHNSHGSDQKYLIWFNENDPNISRSPSGRLEFVELGLHRGRCYITCHGVVHDPREY